MRCCIYIHTESFLNYVCFDFCRSERLIRHLKIYEKGQEKIDEDFDIRNIIKNQRELKQAVDIIKSRMQLEDDPDFDKTIDDDIIDADKESGEEEGEEAEGKGKDEEPKE